MPTTVDYEQMLRAADLRVTRPRLAVLTAVYDNPHADTGSLIEAVRSDLGEVSPQAVYDVLRALSEARLVRRIEPAGSVARYESRVGDNHHHIICRGCGAIADVDCAVILTHHDEFVTQPLWRDADAMVVDTRNVAGEARGGVYSL